MRDTSTAETEIDFRLKKKARQHRHHNFFTPYSSTSTEKHYNAINKINIQHIIFVLIVILRAYRKDTRKFPSQQKNEACTEPSNQQHHRYYQHRQLIDSGD